ncbi:single-stranded-DNA-specific exonuclease RecJ [Streptococcus sciuri]|uniref:Single-stranded-DNA-specific exonuclease RecJ n=1 Tax=Streptococcus sciuri TaxID=2973939 RepID=A0ABT2F4H8_9STRE|nr:single-stranded-DNA-specific exonuclease RecJ [Streptococcus sciuri]MCS4487390.1 single-stranded-DNA-specific exonuclease RecJ [Streptococcus sciuri]
MISATYEWTFNPQVPDEAFLELAKAHNLDGMTSQFLYNRGIDTEEKLLNFLTYDISKLHDPYLLHDMDKAVSRLRLAIESGEQILVYGDYDADGMTSASIAKEALEMLGAEVQVYLPNRFTDGYGPNQSVYQYFIEQQSVSLILTVDNGVAGHEAISYANEQGVDVIVTDHHSLPEELPDAYAIVHPEHPDSNYPFPYLAGCGVAFKLACALLEMVPEELLDLVAIGTIADMVSLTDENRQLVAMGLQVMKTTERIGLQELLRQSSIDLGEVDEETIGFQIAPQLNALGRLDDPNPAIALLTSFDDEEVVAIAEMVHAKNEERKALVQRIYDEAMDMVDLSKPVQILAKEDWHPGVLGIVAGRILEKIAQPVIVLAIDDGRAKGSARSVEALDIFSALNSHRDLFLAFGGHSGAAGMTLEVDKLNSLEEELIDYISSHHLDMSHKKNLQLDVNLRLGELNLELLRNINTLAPFGMDNPKPIFWLKDIAVEQARTMGQNNAHLKMKLSQDGVSYDLIAFHQGGHLLDFQQAQGLELAVTLAINEWNGKTTLQLMLVDARVRGLQLIDCRSKTALIPEEIPDIFDNPNSLLVAVKTVPETEEKLRQLLCQHRFEAIYFKNAIAKPYYLTGFGTRDQFAKLYKTVYQFPEFDVRYKLDELSRYLNIPEILLIKMIQIFEELQFVTITDGVMMLNKEAQNRDISESVIYQNLKKQVIFQEMMALATPKEIYDYLTSDTEKKTE